MPVQSKHLVFLVYPQASLFTLTGLLEVCEQAVLEQERSLGTPAFTYRVSVISASGGITNTYFDCGIKTLPLSAMDGVQIDTLVVCGGLGFREAMKDDKLIAWLTKRGANVRRLCMTGTGSFIVAKTGLLNGRRAVTHWLMNEEFAETFPKVNLVRDLIFLKDNSIWSAAGMGSAIDFTLELLEDDTGREFADKIAQRVLIFLRRSGDQPQISWMLKAQAKEGRRFAKLHEWIYANLKADLRIDVIAAHVGMSPRNFSRVYRSKMGVTPADAVTSLRVEAAYHALERTDTRISVIAYDCGFGDEQRMRRAFMAAVGKSPSEIRDEAIRKRAVEDDESNGSEDNS